MILNNRTNYTIADCRHSTFEMQQVFRDGWWQAGWWWRPPRFWRELCMEGIAIVVHADRRCHLDLDLYTPQNWHGTQKSMCSRWTRFSKVWFFFFASIWFHESYLVGVNILYPDWHLVILAGSRRSPGCSLWTATQWFMALLGVVTQGDVVCAATEMSCTSPTSNGWCTAPVWKIIYFGQVWSELLKVAGIFCM